MNCGSHFGGCRITWHKRCIWIFPWFCRIYTLLDSFLACPFRGHDLGNYVGTYTWLKHLVIFILWLIAKSHGTWTSLHDLWPYSMVVQESGLILHIFIWAEAYEVQVFPKVAINWGCWLITPSCFPVSSWHT